MSKPFDLVQVKINDIFNKANCCPMSYWTGIIIELRQQASNFRSDLTSASQAIEATGFGASIA